VNPSAQFKSKANLDADGYLIGTDGRRVMNDGKPIKAKKNPNIKPISEIDLSQIKNAQTFELLNILKNPVMNSIPVNVKNALPNISDSTQAVSVTDFTKPTINLTVNVDGSADEKTVQAMKTEISKTLIEYTQCFGQMYKEETIRRQSK